MEKLKYLFLILALLKIISIDCFAQSRGVILYDTNSFVASPTNFIRSNILAGAGIIILVDANGRLTVSNILGITTIGDTNTLLRSKGSAPIEWYSPEYIYRPTLKRFTYIAPQGASVNVIGDNTANSGTTTFLGQTATEGMVVNYATAASSNSVAGLSGSASIYRMGRNINYRLAAQIVSTLAQRVWFCLTDQTLATMPASDNPAGNYAAIRRGFTDSNFQYITKDGTTQTITDSGVAIDTAMHTFEILCDDKNLQIIFTIDGGNRKTNTTNLPTPGTGLRMVNAIGNTDANIKNFSLEKVYVEVDH